MGFFRGLFKGIGHCFRAFALIFEKGLWHYLFYPLLIYLALWIIGLFTFAGLASLIAAKLSAALHFDRIADSGDLLSFAKPFLTGYFSLIITWILKVVFWFVAGTFVKYLSLIFLSPVFALLSEAVEKKVTGAMHPFSWRRFFKDIARGIAISLRNMLLEYLLIIGCFMLSLLFPPVTFITAPFLLFVSWYYYGFTMLDYNFERHRLSVSRSARFTRANAGLACGIGMVYAFFMSLPGLAGSIVGLAFGPVIAVAGATTSFLEIKQHTSFSPYEQPR